MKYLCSTQPFLARCPNRFFYGGKHYVYAASTFYPYRSKNPKSSNPMAIYRDLYEPWRDRDVFDKHIAQTRASLKKGVNVQADGEEAERLCEICDKVDILFFYPVVYRIFPSKIHRNRLKKRNSALRGSGEYLIEDLDELILEFDILFLDHQRDPDFSTLIDLPVGDSRRASELLLRRCER